MYFLAAPARPDDTASGNRSDSRALNPAALIGAFLILLASLGFLLLGRMGAASLGGAIAPLLALGVVAVGVGLVLLSDTRSRRRTTAVFGLILLNVLPAAAIVAMAGTGDARELLVWLVIPTLIAACTQNERLHLVQVGCAAAVALIVVVSVGQGLVAMLLDLTVVIGVLVVLDILARQLARSMASRMAELRRLSSSDGLTGALNRRGLISGFPGVVARAQRLGTGVGVLLVDIDRFKDINDRYGHQQGDVVLQRVCAAIAGCLDDGDLLARTGGEEMVVVVAGPAEPVAQAIRAALAASPQSPAVTVSIGFVDAAPEDCIPPQRLWDLVGAADRGLYSAKNAGRDRIRRGHVDGHRPAVPVPVSAGFAHAVRRRPQPGRAHDTLFGWTLVVFDLAGLVALTIGRVTPDPLVTAGLAVGMVGGIAVGLSLLVVKPFLTRTWLAASVVAVDVLIAALLPHATNVSSRQLGLMTVMIPAIAAALYLGRTFTMAHSAFVLVLCIACAHRPGIDAVTWTLLTALSAVALLGASEFIFQLRRWHDRTVDDLHRWSMLDPLTGLANRRGLDLAFARVDRHRAIAVVALDVDDFKQVNDRAGHAAGDELLAHLALGLAELVDADTMVARTGGDEFVVVSTAEASAVVNRRVGVAVAELPEGLSVSTGMVDIPAGSRAGLWDLVALADEQLTAAKNARRAARAARIAAWAPPAGRRRRARTQTALAAIGEDQRAVG